MIYLAYDAMAYDWCGYITMATIGIMAGHYIGTKAGKIAEAVGGLCLIGVGTKVIERLSKDLSSVFPGMKGFSSRNLTYMRKFAESYPDFAIVQEVLAQITWYHNIALLDKVKAPQVVKWYATQAIANGWSRNMMVHHIESNLYQRQHISDKTTNYKNRLPTVQSELAEQLLKDPYSFDFLTIGQEAHEKDIEKQLVQHITKFLLELGTGFAFVGQQT